MKTSDLEQSYAGSEKSPADFSEEAALLEEGGSKQARAVVDRWLADATSGLEGDAEPQRAEDLLPILYDELRRLARARLAQERAGQTLQATALVHEAWLRLVRGGDPGWNGRSHFFGAAALAMRRILVENARRKGRLRHGGGQRRVELEHLDRTAAGVERCDAAEVIAVDEAVRSLEARDPRKAKLVELRWFAGLSNREVAEVLGVSVGTVERDWRFVRAFLRTRLEKSGGTAMAPEERGAGA